MKYKMKPGRMLFLAIDVLVLCLITFVCFIPIWNIVMASLSDPTSLNSYTRLVFWPLKRMDVQAYKVILQYKTLWISYRNTIGYIIATCLLTSILTTMAGYVLSRQRLYYRNVYMMIITFTMIFNGGMIPTYMVIRRLRMIDTPFAMIVPGVLSVFYILVMKTSMENVPLELEEAARMDGASDFTIMLHVIFPLCKASFAVIILFTAVAKWNDYFTALLYLPNKSEYYPLQMVLRNILVTSTSDLTSDTVSMQNNISLYKKNIEYACIVVSTLPILCIYPFVQKYFVTGVTLGAVKN